MRKSNRFENTLSRRLQNPKRLGILKERKIMSKNKQKRNEFRKNNSKDGRGHPSYIYARQGDDYFYLGLTHSPITKGVKNIELEKNPDPKDKRQAYVRPKAEKKNKSSFGKKLIGWFFSDNDKEKIKKYKK